MTVVITGEGVEQDGELIHPFDPSGDLEYEALFYGICMIYLLTHTPRATVRYEDGAELLARLEASRMEFIKSLGEGLG